jgi:hypothetical protein
MRPSLLHPLGEPRHSRRHRRERGAATSEPVLSACDPAVARVREAGGPVDQASYNCQCGCVFSAPVSTTVPCPHCGVAQAW